MKKANNETLVIFRRFREGGELIALFPHLPGTSDPATCESYMHVGQHSSADAALTCGGGTHHNSPTIPAYTDEADVRELAKELESLGYTLKIRRKMPGDGYRVRSRILDEMRRPQPAESSAA